MAAVSVMNRVELPAAPTETSSIRGRQAFRHRSENADITGLANLCEVVMSHKDELAVMFLHVEPHELLRPVRELLDARDPSQDDASKPAAVFLRKLCSDRHH